MFKFDTSVVFEANYNATADVVINQGGTDSGKTYAILQALVILATTTKPPDTDPIITVLSKSIPDTKKGAWRTMQGIISANHRMKYFIRHTNEGDRIIYFTSGWVMEFLGATDEQAAKQGKRQYLFCNEANGLPYTIFWQMAKRTRIRTWIDYNPSEPFWAHVKLIGTGPGANDLNATVQLIISDHRHNPFLTDKDHSKTEGIKDPELFKVYARGLTGNLQGIIYPAWRRVADKDFPWEEDGKFGAVDFGYTNDPTAAVIMVKVAKTIFVHELCYEPGLTAMRLKKLFRAAGLHSEAPVYCEHDEDMIRQLRRLEVLALAAKKGPNSIKAGISKVKEYDICFTGSSGNIEYERQRYMWQKDKLSNKLTNVPSEADNHLMDAIRYGVYTRYFRTV